ncbi:MAG: NifU family protein [Flavobacteriaceae bacterium]|jgi:Fe-S cluster biogenesis protein NfuA|nr:NifU family protein [Pelagibacterales bacterium]MBT4709484.1 NifU family protein [Flavobacteriaceae bacterium]MBT4959434.1 NifU family protein [Flavobacteriaceae bacterium]MBT6169631.1 NifU family protein [Flavobacteriaceae bacterium]MBT6449025.1 NifU family protein [Flavobacteriaceae bacterium]|tara:strand:+ start:123 stop:359 length:237 start_codon:yes stop_codon:yes gene_type:complete
MNKNLLTKKVESALEEIRPFLLSDGGDIALLSIKDNIVKVQLMGNCVSCTVNQMTLKNGVEMTIKKHAPQIKKVISVE